MNGLLSAKEAAALLGISVSHFHKLKVQGAMKKFEMARPLGLLGKRSVYRYSRVLIEAFLAGESPSRIGRRA